MVAGGWQRRTGERPVFYGRERERARLHALLDDAGAGRGSLVLIAGEAGIGKTTLVADLIHEAEQRGCLALAGGCYDLTTTPPYGPWTEAIRGYEPRENRPAVPAWFGDPKAMAQVGSQAALFEEVRRFFAAIAEWQPLVVILEDMHWTDAASLEALRYLARSLGETAILLVATYRDDELTRRHKLYQLLPLLVRESQAQRIHVQQLVRDDIRELIASHYDLTAADSERLSQHVSQRSEGNPFFAGEILQSLEDDRVLQQAHDAWTLGNLEPARVPLLLRQTIDVRLDRLAPETRSALRVAAVIGQVVPIDLWQRVTEGAAGNIDEVMTEALAAHVIDEATSSSNLQFRHALLREALYESLTLSERRAWHRLVGGMLAELPNADPDEVSHHFQAAGDAQAISWLVRAGFRAEGSYAFGVAANHYAHAQALLESDPDAQHARGWLLVHIGHLLRYGDAQQSLAHLEEAHRIAREVSDPVLAAAILEVQGLLLCFRNQVGDGLERMAEAGRLMDQATAEDDQRARQAIFSIFPEDIPTDPRSTLSGLPSWVGIAAGVYPMRQSYPLWLAQAGRYREAIETGESLVRMVSSVTDDPVIIQYLCGDAYGGLAVAAHGLGQPETARNWRGSALAAYRTIGHFVLVANVLILELDHLLTYYPEQIARRRQVADAWLAASNRSGGALATSGWMGQLPLDILEGRWEQARNIALSVSLHFTHHQYARLLILGPLGIERNEPELLDLTRTDIDAVLPDGAETAPGDRDFRCSVTAQRHAIQLALESNDPDQDQARRWLEAHGHWLGWSGAVIGRAEAQLLWSRYHRLADDIERAREHAEQALEHASNPRQPLALIAAHRILGELETEAGHINEAADHLTASLELAARCEAPYEQALCQLALAELAAARGNSQEASRMLREARAICDRLGAERSLERAAQIEAGFRRRSTDHPAGLSDREVEVLALVAEGMTNAAAGDALFISRRTVAQHLRSVYNKLGVNNRAAAVARWAELNS